MAYIDPNDKRVKMQSSYYNPLVWVAGIVATILVVMLVASYFGTRDDTPFTRRGDDPATTDVIPPSSTEDAH